MFDMMVFIKIVLSYGIRIKNSKNGIYAEELSKLFNKNFQKLSLKLYIRKLLFIISKISLGSFDYLTVNIFSAKIAKTNLFELSKTILKELCHADLKICVISSEIKLSLNILGAYLTFRELEGRKSR